MKKLIIAFAVVLGLSVSAQAADVVFALDGVNSKLENTQAKIEAKKAAVKAKQDEKAAKLQAKKDALKAKQDAKTAEAKAKKEADEKARAEKAAAAKAKVENVKGNLNNLKNSLTISK